mgnify:CR=1 FL=1
MHPRRHGATALVLALLLLHSGCGGDGPPAGGEGDRSSGAEGGRSAGGELFSARDAGVTSPPLAHHEILPGEGVTGPDALPPLRPAPDDAEAVFLADLTTHCTQPPPPEGAEGAATHEVIRAAYPGRTTVNTLSNPAPFEGAVLRMVLDDCDGDILPIPFLVDEDRSRTWVLAFEEEKELYLSGDRLFVDAGARDGIRVGDRFTAWARGSQGSAEVTPAAEFQVVRVDEGGATLRITRMIQPRQLTVGTLLERTAQMP